MLDGKRYYRTFPDENRERPSVRAVLDALQKLEALFHKHISQFRGNQPKAARSANPRKRGRTNAED